MKKNKLKIYKYFLIILSILLLIINGLDVNFKINNYTVIFFLILCYPILIEFLEFVKSNLANVKFKNYEISFNNLSLREQIFIFLNGIILHNQWTFYETRSGESKLGDAFKILIEDLINNSRNELFKEIEKWFNSKNDNVVWFASEIVGYFQIKEFEKILQKKIKRIDNIGNLSNSQLNCLWAYSRFNNYEALIDFLLKTKNEKNIQWILHAFYQMTKENHATPSLFLPALKKVLEEEISEQIKEQAKELIEIFESKEKTLYNIQYKKLDKISKNEYTK